MNLLHEVMYKVREDHPHHPGRMGRFQFLGGPRSDCIVLADITVPQQMFAVGLRDLEDFNPDTEGKRQRSFKLRRALIESGVEYKCAKCGNEGEWNGQPLMLQVEHKNQNWLDDRRENLEFLCPNCHSQTPGWCGSKGFAEITTTAKYCKHIRTKRNGLVGE